MRRTVGVFVCFGASLHTFVLIPVYIEGVSFIHLVTS